MPDSRALAAPTFRHKHTLGQTRTILTGLGHERYYAERAATHGIPDAIDELALQIIGAVPPALRVGLWETYVNAVERARHRRGLEDMMAAALIANAEARQLKAEWDEAYDALRAAGLEADADHPIAARYRAASAAVNHAKRKREAQGLTMLNGAA